MAYYFNSKFHNFHGVKEHFKASTLQQCLTANSFTDLANCAYNTVRVTGIDVAFHRLMDLEWEAAAGRQLCMDGQKTIVRPLFLDFDIDSGNATTAAYKSHLSNEMNKCHSKSFIYENILERVVGCTGSSISSIANAYFSYEIPEQVKNQYLEYLGAPYPYMSPMGCGDFMKYIQQQYEDINIVANTLLNVGDVMVPGNILANYDN